MLVGMSAAATGELRREPCDLSTVGKIPGQNANGSCELREVNGSQLQALEVV